MDHRNVFLGELTRKELGEAISSGAVQGAIVPAGACEQHQDHLAMIHDTASVTEIARRVADRFFPRVLVFPERVRVDEIRYENALRGTVSKGGHILEAVVEGVSGEVRGMLGE